MSSVKATPKDASDLWQLLVGRGFRKAREIEMPDRKIRATCSEFPEHFLSTQQGYKVVQQATDAEIENAVADLISRATQTRRRAGALEEVLRNRRQKALL